MWDKEDTFAPARWMMLAPALSVLALCLLTVADQENNGQSHSYFCRLDTNPPTQGKNTRSNPDVIFVHRHERLSAERTCCC